MLRRNRHRKVEKKLWEVEVTLVPHSGKHKPKCPTLGLQKYSYSGTDNYYSNPYLYQDAARREKKINRKLDGARKRCHI